ncbi:MAG TPA: tetratricopeptide repeat protein, partial [Rhodanobacteraceae bacterium]
MIRHAVWPALGAAGFAILLAGCSRPPLPPPQSQSHQDHVSPTAMVEAIRAARASDHSVVQVTPLRDPSVTGYLDSARSDENAGKYKSALKKFDAALKLSPEAPDILQERAEVEVLMRDYTAADADARRSWALGPRVGG